MDFREIVGEVFVGVRVGGKDSAQIGAPVLSRWRRGVDAGEVTVGTGRRTRGPDFGETFNEV